MQTLGPSRLQSSPCRCDSSEPKPRAFYRRPATRKTIAASSLPKNVSAWLCRIGRTSVASDTTMRTNPLPARISALLPFWLPPTRNSGIAAPLALAAISEKHGRMQKQALGAWSIQRHRDLGPNQRFRSGNFFLHPPCRIALLHGRRFLKSNWRAPGENRRSRAGTVKKKPLARLSARKIDSMYFSPYALSLARLCREGPQHRRQTWRFHSLCGALLF